MKILRVLGLFLFVLVMVQASCLAAGGPVRLLFPSGAEVRISENGDGSWGWQEGTDDYTLIIRQTGEVVFSHDNKPLARGRFKGEKITLRTDADGTFLKFKISADRIKLPFSSPDSPWQIKVKADKIKVVHGDTLFGKVKYYPDNGKLKAKDVAGNTLAEMRGLGGLSAAPGVFLVEPIGKEQAICLTLYLLAVGR